MPIVWYQCINCSYRFNVITDGSNLNSNPHCHLCGSAELKRIPWKDVEKHNREVLAHWNPGGSTQ
jgi:putative FmdB family regulatory protein